MYFEELDTELTKEMIDYIENLATFKVFIFNFGIHGTKEYQTFNEEERKIVITEFIKDRLKINYMRLRNFKESFVTNY